jgi:hypothetical protein
VISYYRAVFSIRFTHAAHLGWSPLYSAHDALLEHLEAHSGPDETLGAWAYPACGCDVHCAQRETTTHGTLPSARYCIEGTAHLPPLRLKVSSQPASRCIVGNRWSPREAPLLFVRQTPCHDLRHGVAGGFT